MNIRQAIKQSISSSVTRKGPQAASIARNITQLDNTQQSYFSINGGTGINLSTDFEVICSFSSSRKAVVEHAWGGSNFGLRIDQNGYPRLVLPRLDLAQTPRYPKFDKFFIEKDIVYTVSVSRSSDTFTMKINGISQSITFSDIDPTINLYVIGAWESVDAQVVTNQLNGFIYDFKALDQGSVVAAFDISSNEYTPYSQGEPDSFTAGIPIDLGLGFSNDFTGSGYAAHNNGIIEIIKTETTGETGWNFNVLDDTKNYILYCDVEVLSGGGAAIARWTTDWNSLGSVVPFSNSGPISVDLPGTGRIRFRINTSNTGHVKFSNIRVYEVPNVLRAINIVPEDTNLYTKVGSQEWVSENLLENGDFSKGTESWTFADGWTVNNGVANRDGDATNDGIQQENVFQQGLEYWLSLNITNRTVGNLFAYIGQGTQSFYIDSARNGFQKVKIKSTSTQTKLLLNGSNSFDGSVDNVEVNRVLKISQPPQDRNLVKFDSTSQSYIELSKKITLNGDFEIELKILPTESGGYILADSNSASSHNRFGIVASNDGRFFGILDDAAFFDVVTYTNKISTVVVRREAGIAYVTQDGEDKGSGPSTNQVSFNCIGKPYGGSTSVPYLDTYLLDVKIWEGGNRDSGYLILDMPINEPGLNNYTVATSRTAVLGDETLADPSFRAYDAWIASYYEYLPGSILVTSDTGQGRGVLHQSHGMEVGKNYLITVSIKDLVGPVNIAIRARYASGDILATVNSAGTVHFLYTHNDAAKDKIHLQCASAAEGYFICSDVSIKEIETGRLGSYINFVEEDSNRYTYWRDGMYVSDNLVTQEVWENPHVAPSIFTYDEASNTWYMQGTGGYESLVLIESIKQPEKMVVSGRIDELEGAGVMLGSNSAPVINANGFFSEIVSTEDITTQLFKRSSGIVNARIFKPKIQEILELQS